MRNFITNKVRNLFAGIAGFLIAVPLLIAGGVYAATVYPAGSLLQPGDVTSAHIRDNQIVNADINSAAGILLSKLHGGGTAGLIPFSNGSTLATSTALSFATTTNTLSVTGGLSVSATTTLKGVAYQFPSADGTNNQTLTTNGAGTLAWSTLSQPYVSTNFTAGESITSGDAVALGDGAQVSGTYAAASGVQTSALATSYWIGQATTTPSSIGVGISAITGNYSNLTGNATTSNLVGYIEADNAGTPSGTILASATTTCSVGAWNNHVCDVNFTTPYAATPNTKYWFIVYDLNNTGIVVMNKTNDTANAGKSSTNSGGSWSTLGNDLQLTWKYATNYAGRAYKASSASVNFRLNDFVGFATASAATSSTATVAEFGWLSLFSGLGIGQTYFLNDTQGTIGTSAGSQSLIVGRGVTATTLMTRNP